MTSGAAKRLKSSHKAFTAKVDAMVGKRLAERRAAADLTQANVGQPVGVSMQQAQRYEAGISSMDVATLISMARTCGCRPSDLLVDFEGGDPPAPPLSPEAMAVGKTVDAIKRPGLRGLVKAIANIVRSHDRSAE